MSKPTVLGGRSSPTVYSLATHGLSTAFRWAKLGELQASASDDRRYREPPLSSHRHSARGGRTCGGRRSLHPSAFCLYNSTCFKSHLLLCNHMFTPAQKKHSFSGGKKVLGIRGFTIPNSFFSGCNLIVSYSWCVGSRCVFEINQFTFVQSHLPVIHTRSTRRSPAPEQFTSQ